MKSRSPNYPWSRWFNRKRFRLLRGLDYNCGDGSFAQQIRNAAARLGVSVRLVETELGFLVEVREPCLK